MRHLTRFLSAVLLAVALVGSAGAILAAPAQAKIWNAPEADPDVNPSKKNDEFENRVLIQINKARKARGLKKVRVFESCVDNHSERWARRIKRQDAFEHRNQMTVIKRCDLMWTGETLVRGTGLSPQTAVNAWLNSPSHYDVLMKDRARWAGVGVRVDYEGRTVVVLNFGDPS